MKTLANIATQLAEPFAIKDVELLPKGSYEKEGKVSCMALPYADPRVYQDRLNQLAPGEWSTPPPIALTVGDKLVCFVTVTICGISHSDVGEAGPGENQGTEAWSQGFKRACSHFGLGRYLYDLEKIWVPFDKQKKRIDLDADGIQAIVWRMYNKAGIVGSRAPQSNDVRTLPERSPTPPEAAQRPVEGQSIAVPSAAELQARCEKLYGPGKWASAKVKILGVDRADAELTDGDRAKIAKALYHAETKAASRQASAA